MIFLLDVEKSSGPLLRPNNQQHLDWTLCALAASARISRVGVGVGWDWPQCPHLPSASPHPRSTGSRVTPQLGGDSRFISSKQLCSPCARAPGDERPRFAGARVGSRGLEGTSGMQAEVETCER